MSNNSSALVGKEIWYTSKKKLSVDVNYGDFGNYILTYFFIVYHMSTTRTYCYQTH